MKATVAKGHDLNYAWRAVGEASRGAVTFRSAAEAGKPPGTWWAPGAEKLGFTDGQCGELRDHLGGSSPGPRCELNSAPKKAKRPLLETWK